VDDQAPLRVLEQWFSDNCDGDWEHEFGVHIESLDNPGWMIRVDLVGTPGEGFQMETLSVEDSDVSWLRLWSDGRVLSLACGPAGLHDGIARIAAILNDLRPSNLG
jgi:hypothetical protein